MAAGPLFAGGERDSVCGPVAQFAAASITQPIEFHGAARITGVAVGHAVNVRVSRVGVGRLRSLTLLGHLAGGDVPEWGSYSKSFTVTPSNPGQAVAELQVIDRGQPASAGPFVITYRIGGRTYRSDAVLTYKIPAGSCG